MLLIPALRIFFDIGQKEAQAINLYCFIPASVCALFIHIKKKNVDFKSAAPIIIMGVPSAILGAYLSVHIPPAALGRLFGIFILIFGIREIFLSFRAIRAKKRKKA